MRAYLRLRVRYLFHGAPGRPPGAAIEVAPPTPDAARCRRSRPAARAGTAAGDSRRQPEHGRPAAAPSGSWLRWNGSAPRSIVSGMARGLLGADHPLLARHRRRESLREADLVVLAGVPADFRLDYGNHIRRGACVVSANRSRCDLRKNRRPDVGILGDAALAVPGIADALPDEPSRWEEWREQVRARDRAREAEIAELAGQATDGVNPVRLCQEIAHALPPGTVIVGDGGDIVATASYVLRPDGPLRWLDPGVFGTLGVGAGFALGAAMVHPDAPVWIVFGDGAVGYGITEFDTFVRHGVPVVAVVGNDASWSQIAREQLDLLHDDVGTVLAPTRYDQVAAGFGAVGLHVDHVDELSAALAKARATGRTRPRRRPDRPNGLPQGLDLDVTGTTATARPAGHEPAPSSTPSIRSRRLPV